MSSENVSVRCSKIWVRILQKILKVHAKVKRYYGTLKCMRCPHWLTSTMCKFDQIHYRIVDSYDLPLKRGNSFIKGVKFYSCLYIHFYFCSVKLPLIFVN